MMVLRDATRTTVAQTLANTDTFGGVSQFDTSFTVQNAAALEAIREGANVRAESARFTGGGFPDVTVDPANITFNRAGFVVAGGSRPASPTTGPTPGFTFTETSTTAGQTRFRITSPAARDAAEAGVFTLERLTAGSPAVAIPATLDGNDLVLSRGVSSAGVTINVRYSNPAFVTRGAPFGSDEFRIDYNTPAYTQVAHRLYPADRCTWVQEDTAENGGGYHIRDAVFHGVSTTTNLAEPLLGVLGKTGRFVAITNTR